MFGNESSNQEVVDSNITLEAKDVGLDACTVNVCIPKVEPCYPPCNSNEDLTNYDPVVEPSIPFTAPYKVRDPFIVLERCDKIWETLKLIKETDAPVTNSKTSIETTNTTENLNIETTALTESTQPYIKYQPVLGNDNTALPNFTFSVKAAKKLYQCPTCGKQYSERRGLRFHSSKIHGIEIPIIHRKRSIARVEDKDVQQRQSEVAGKGNESNRKSDSKKNEKEQNKDNQTDIPPGTKTEPQKSNLQVQKKKKNSLTITDTSNGNIQVKDTLVQKETSKNQDTSCITKDNIEQKEPLNERATCILCRQRVKYIKRHLTEYHKIGCTETMIKELTETFSNTEKHTKDVKGVQNTVKSTNDITQAELQQSNHQNSEQKGKKRKTTASSPDGTKKRLKSNNSDTSEFQNISESNVPKATSEKEKYTCDICHGIYVNRTSYRNHVRCHFVRGETKENFHLFECRYTKSPLRRKQKEPLSVTNSAEEKPKEDNGSITEGVTVSKPAQNSVESHEKHAKDMETICSCGRLFRNPYTLFIHKRNCKIEPTQGVKRNSADRDSGCGINITIKKKNDSYEIVEKRLSNENKSVDSYNQPSHCQKECDVVSDTSDYISEDCSNNQDANQLPETLELSKYSKNHSILKLQVVDEDIEVDIEDLPDTAFHDIVNASLTECKPKTCSSEVDTMKKEIPTLKSLCERMIYKHKLIRLYSKKKRKNKKQQTICVCGEKFKSYKSFVIHMHTNHALLLTCPYCEEKFDHYNQFYKHLCTVTSGKTFIEKKRTLNCQYCSTSLPNIPQYDKHMKSLHPDTMLPLHCQKCPQRFSSFKMRQEHFSSEHSTVVCSICYKKYHFIVEAKHEAYHYGLGYPCHLCKKTYTNKSFMELHIARQHLKKY